MGSDTWLTETYFGINITGDCFDLKKTKSSFIHSFLKADHIKALVDFVSQIGSILGVAASPSNIKKGNLANGMIDVGSETCPDFDAMLRTLTRAMTKHELLLVEKNFNNLFHIQMRICLALPNCFRAAISSLE